MSEGYPETPPFGLVRSELDKLCYRENLANYKSLKVDYLIANNYWKLTDNPITLEWTLVKEALGQTYLFKG